MKTKILSLIVAGLISLGAFAQEKAYKALAATGNVTVERATTPGKYEPIKMGTPIYKNDKIIVGQSGYLGLTSTAGKTVEIKNEGIYAVNDLSGSLSADNSSVAQKYIAYIFDGLTNTGGGSNMSLPGSVERSLGNAGINLYLPQTTKVLPDKKSNISWVAAEEVEMYHVVITNLFDEEVFSFETAETSANIDFSALNLDPTEVYKMAIYNKANKKVQSGVVTLEIMPSDNATQVKSDFTAIEEAAGGNDAISNLVKASFYEQNGMYMEAIEYFEKAIEAEPNVEEYKTLYENFKVKTGIKGDL